MEDFLTVIGHINIDVIIDVDAIPKFGSIEVRNHRSMLGGTGANIALVSSMLGVPVTLLSKISKNFPEDIVKPLYRKNINLILEKTEEDGPVCYIVDSRDEQIAFMVQGPLNSPGKMYNLKSKYCHFATSNPDWILGLMERCTCTIVFDPGQEISYRWNKDKLRDAMEKSDIIILNNKEFEYSKDIIPDGKEVIVTMGKEGCRFNDSIIKSEHISSKSTVGAGDAFRAGLYASLYRGMDMVEACRCANEIAYNYIENDRSLDLLDWRVLCRDNDVR